VSTRTDALSAPIACSRSSRKPLDSEREPSRETVTASVTFVAIRRLPASRECEPWT
jgi:hypothetical protein